MATDADEIVLTRGHCERGRWSLQGSRRRNQFSPFVHVAVKAAGDDKFSVVTQAITSGQRDVVAAVLGAPAFLTGFTQEHHQTLWGIARKALEPEKQARLELAQRDLKVLANGREWFQTWANEFAAKWSQPHASIISRGLE